MTTRRERYAGGLLLCCWGGDCTKPAVILHGYDFGGTQCQVFDPYCGYHADVNEDSVRNAGGYSIVRMPLGGFGSDEYIIGEAIGLAFERLAVPS